MSDSNPVPTPGATPAEVVDLGVRQYGLRLDAAARGRVAQQVERLQQVMAVLNAVELSLHDEPAPEFARDGAPAP